MSCASGLVCLDGQCSSTCDVGKTSCGGSCTDLDADPANCGGCDDACAKEESCIGGICAPECGQDELLCANTCINPLNDEEHCGGCDAACDEEQDCAFGQCVDATVNHVLIGGQSLSLGSNAMALSTEQPYENLMFNTGVRAGLNNLTSFVPLVESQNGKYGETIASGMANLVAELEQAKGRSYVISASAHGIGGLSYAELKKGTNSFTEGMAQVQAAAEVAAEQGDTLAVRAVAIIHGETDHVIGTANYDQNLLEWQSDYEAETRAITNQLPPVPMFLCQLSSWTKHNAASSPIPIAQLAAADARPGRIFIVGPKYFLPYSDGVHLTGHGERWLGEYYAKAYHRVLVEGEPWTPLRPQTLSRDGTVIVADFHVPSPPLAFDTEQVSDPGNFGFEFWDSSGAPPAVVDVKIIGDTQVQITLAELPVGDNERLRYAYTGEPGNLGGPMTGPRGNLRDSDPTPSRHGYALYNWAVHFDEPLD